MCILVLEAQIPFSGSKETTLELFDLCGRTLCKFSTRKSYGLWNTLRVPGRYHDDSPCSPLGIRPFVAHKRALHDEQISAGDDQDFVDSLSHFPYYPLLISFVSNLQTRCPSPFTLYRLGRTGLVVFQTLSVRLAIALHYSQFLKYAY